MAIAHSILVRAFHMLSRHQLYQELGAHDCDDQRRHQLVDWLARRLERLGYRVSFEPVSVSA